MNLIKKIAATFVALLTLGFLLGQSYFGPNIKSYFGPSTLLAENNTSSSIPKDSIPSSKMTYGHFLEYLDMGWVTKVDLYENGRMAVIQASSPELGNRPQQIRVEIPAGASQLITKLRTSNVDFFFSEHEKVKIISDSKVYFFIVFILSKYKNKS